MTRGWRTAHDVLERRFWSKVSYPGGAAGCWLWHGRTTINGYGVFRGGDRRVMAHRYAYGVTIGEIPHGLDLDHVRSRGCRHRNCVNPFHLEPVTRAENVRRADRTSIVRKKKETCRSGHRYSVGGSYKRKDGQRECRECSQVRAARRRAKAKAAMSATTNNV